MKGFTTTFTTCKKLWSQVSVVICMLLMAFLFSTNSIAQYGVAPVNPPAGGFNIDGRVVTSGGGLGPGGIVYGPNDWVPTLFTTGGVPAPPYNGAAYAGRIFHKVDPYSDNVNDDEFATSDKLEDNPNTWQWRSGAPPSKDDINNSLVFITQNPDDGHFWFLVTGDREATNGTSFLDIEFYQGTITKQGTLCTDPPVLGGTGRFCSDGPNGGRTIGDLDVTIDYTGGGNLATVSFLQWTNSGTDQNPIYNYVTITPGPSAFVAANNTAVMPTSVPYGAFGNTEYDSLQFVESAIDLTAILGPSNNPCAPIPYKTIFIKTKSSASPTAQLKDFIEPFGVSFCTDHTPPTITPSSTASTVLGCNPSTATISGALDGATATDNCTSGLSPTASDGAVGSTGCSRSQTRTWFVSDGCGNTATASRTVTWTADLTPPVVTPSSSASTSLGCNPTTATINTTLDGATASDNCSGALTPTPSDGPVGSTGCSRSLTRTWIATDGCGNTGTASRTVTWTFDNTAPVVTASSSASTSLGCNPSTADISNALDGATATDNCSGALTPTSSDGPVGSTGCARSQTRTWTATDGCGNTGTTSRTVTWTSDVTAPVITPTSTINTLGCNPNSATIDGALGSATASDNCSGVLTPTASDGAVGASGCARSQTRTWTATDGCGNTASASHTVTWTVDVTPPTVTPTSTASTSLGCNPSGTVINGALGGATASDNCSGALTPSSSDGSVGSTGCARSQTRSWIATDGCGNTATASRTVNWTFDVTAPVITPTSTINTLGCNPNSATIDGALGSATASDNCSGVLTPTPSDGAVGSTGCARSQTRTWIATDGCNNTGTASHTVTWTFDVTPPTLTATGTGTLDLGCNPSTASVNGTLGGVSASDNCGGTPSVTASDGAVGSTGCARSSTRTWTATDGCGNTATLSRTVTWTFDMTPPVVTPSSTASTSLGCNPTTATIDGALGGATASDNCSGVLTPTASDGAVGSTGCSRSQTRTWTAADGCGNTASASRTVNWTFDITPPVVTASNTASTVLGCNPSTADINNALDGATASDACSGTLTPTSSDGAVGSTGCSRSQTRTWTATDACGNTGTTSRTVTWTFDILPPTVTPSSTASTSLGCNPTTATISGALGGATASDNCSGVLTPSANDGTVGSTGCARTQTRTWLATDGCGNTATASRTVNWTFDVTAPVVTPTSTTNTLGCNPNSATIDGALGGATASDNCSGVLTPTASDGAVGSTGCARSQTRTWIATDACGNTGTASHSISWTFDVTAPVVTATNTATTALGCNPTTATISNGLGGATATDNCSGSLTPTSSDGAVGSTGCARSQTRTWLATDACGNTGTTSRTVSWLFDILPPVVTPTSTAATTLGCNPTTATINGALGGATASDNCDGAISPASSDGTVGSTGCTRSQTRTWTAADGCGNTASASRTVTWTADVTPPVVTPTATTSTSLGCNPNSATINGGLGGATASDNCSGVLTPTSSDGSVGSTGCSRSQTRSWLATDGCGNTATASRTVNWTFDVTNPVVTPTSTGTTVLGCNPNTATINGGLGGATASDNCSGVLTPTSSDGAVGSTGCARSQTRTWSAVDGCGNTGTASRTVTWTFDVTPPTLVGVPSNVDVDCDASVSPANVTASDNCSSTASVTLNETSQDTDCSTGFRQIVTRTWTATDACGNTSTARQTIRVRCCALYCTYTQGAYGNAGGLQCDGTNLLTTFQAIQNSINSFTLGFYAPAIYPNPPFTNQMLIMGLNGRSVYINSSTIDVNLVIKYLPGGGQSKELNSGNMSIHDPNFESTYTKNNHIKNTLFAQNLTLGLNIGLKPNLANLVLQAGELATAEPDGGCGSNTPVTRHCDQTPSNEYSYATFDASVINAITGPKTVKGLFLLANRALGDSDHIAGSENGASLGAIADACDKINNVFDECRIFVGWNVQHCPAVQRVTVTPETGGTTPVNNLSVSTYPNPYTDNVKFVVQSPITGNGVLDVYNSLGQKIQTVYQGMVVAGRSQVIDYKVPVGNRTNLIYIFRVGGQQVAGKLIRID